MLVDFGHSGSISVPSVSQLARGGDTLRIPTTFGGEDHVLQLESQVEELLLEADLTLLLVACIALLLLSYTCIVDDCHAIHNLLHVNRRELGATQAFGQLIEECGNVVRCLSLVKDVTYLLGKFDIVLL